MTNSSPLHVSSGSLAAIRPVLEDVVAGTVTEAPGGFDVDGWMEGIDARELNRDMILWIANLLIPPESI